MLFDHKNEAAVPHSANGSDAVEIQLVGVKRAA